MSRNVSENAKECRDLQRIFKNSIIFLTFVTFISYTNERVYFSIRRFNRLLTMRYTLTGCLVVSPPCSRSAVPLLDLLQIDDHFLSIFFHAVHASRQDKTK